MESPPARRSLLLRPALRLLLRGLLGSAILVAAPPPELLPRAFPPGAQASLPPEIRGRTWSEYRSTAYDGVGGTRLFLVLPEATAGARFQAFPDYARWIALAEQDGAVLVFPDPGEDGRWDADDLPYLEALYRHCDTYAIEGASRYLAAYGEAGIPAALFAIRHTQLIAGAAFIRPRFPDLAPVRGSGLPLAVLLVDAQAGAAQGLVAYFKDANQAHERRILGRGDVIHRRRGSSPWNRDYARSHFVRLLRAPRPSVPDVVYRELFRTVARWRTVAGAGTLRARTRAGALPGFLALEAGAHPARDVVYVPASLRRRRHPAPAPLVILFHGVSCNGEYFLDQTEWFRAAERHGFLVFAPSAPGYRWNREAEALDRWAARLRELGGRGFLLSGRRFPVDASRVYLYGFSNGSFFGGRLLMRHPDLFAAAALWAGVHDPAGLVPKPEEPLPVWYGIGRKDAYYPSWEADGRAFVRHYALLAGADVRAPREVRHAAFGVEGFLLTQIFQGPELEVRYSEAPELEHGNINELPARIWEEFFSAYRKVRGRSVRVEPGRPAGPQAQVGVRMGESQAE